MNNANSPYWTAFYVKPKSEKKTAERLESQGFEIFCPLVEEFRQWSDRKKKIKSPLFRGYIFAKVEEASRLAILQDTSVVSNVMWLKKPAQIRDEEIQAIKLFLGEAQFVSLENWRLYSIGDLVKVTAGPFAGNDAVLEDVKRNRMIIRLEGVRLQVELHSSNIQKVNPQES